MVLEHHVADHAGRDPGKVHHHEHEHRGDQRLRRQRHQQRPRHGHAHAQQQHEHAQQQVGKPHRRHGAQQLGGVERAAQAAGLDQHHQRGRNQQRGHQAAQIGEPFTGLGHEGDDQPVDHQHAQEFPGQMGPGGVAGRAVVVRAAHHTHGRHGRHLEAVPRRGQQDAHHREETDQRRSGHGQRAQRQERGVGQGLALEREQKKRVELVPERRDFRRLVARTHPGGGRL